MNIHMCKEGGADDAFSALCFGLKRDVWRGPSTWKQKSILHNIKDMQLSDCVRWIVGMGIQLYIDFMTWHHKLWVKKSVHVNSAIVQVKKLDLRVFEHGTVVGLNILETTGLLGFPYTTFSRVYRETVAQITTSFNQGMEKSISVCTYCTLKQIDYSSRRPHWDPELLVRGASISASTFGW